MKKKRKNKNEFVIVPNVETRISVGGGVVSNVEPAIVTQT